MPNVFRMSSFQQMSMNLHTSGMLQLIVHHWYDSFRVYILLWLLIFQIISAKLVVSFGPSCRPIVMFLACMFCLSLSWFQVISFIQFDYLELFCCPSVTRSTCHMDFYPSYICMFDCGHLLSLKVNDLVFKCCNIFQGRVRVMALIVKLFSVSSSVASRAHNSNLLNLLEAEVDSKNDMLTTLSVLELLYEVKYNSIQVWAYDITLLPVGIDWFWSCAKI